MGRPSIHGRIIGRSDQKRGSENEIASLGLVSGGLSLGIGFASLKELVGVDIGFIPLRFGNPHQRPRWGFLFYWHLVCISESVSELVAH